jgi:hypothetical protein
MTGLRFGSLIARSPTFIPLFNLICSTVISAILLPLWKFHRRRGLFTPPKTSHRSNRISW